MAANHFALPCHISPHHRADRVFVSYISLARQRITTFPLPLTKARHRIPSHYLPVILKPAISGISPCRTNGVFIRFLRYRPDVPFTALNRIESPCRIPSNAASLAKSLPLTNAQPQP
jgi:hypothetical protein